MTGIYFQSPEPDLSHFHSLGNLGIWTDSIAESKVGTAPNSFMLLWALGVSLLIHSVLFFVNITPSKTLGISVPSQTLRIELRSVQSVPVLPSETIEPVLVESVPLLPALLPEPGKANEKLDNTKKKMLLEKADKKSLYIPITPDELRSLQDKPVYALEPTDADLKEVSTKPFGSVFDPRLRKKLQDQYAEKQAKASGLSTYEMANGATVEKLKDGHCLTTLSQGKKEKETNWYHTGCSEKSESERMMDRVNQSLR